MHFQYVCLFAAVEEFGVQPDESRFVHNLKSTWFKKAEITKEPYLCSLRNLLLYFPGKMFQIMICCLNFHLVSFAFWHIMNMVEYLHDIHHVYQGSSAFFLIIFLGIIILVHVEYTNEQQKEISELSIPGHYSLTKIKWKPGS